LTGANGVLQPTESRGGSTFFAVAPGTYQLSAAFLGAETVRQTVEVMSSAKSDGSVAEDRKLNVTLAPID